MGRTALSLLGRSKAPASQEGVRGTSPLLHNRPLRWLILVVSVLGMILLPFFFLEDRMTAIWASILEATHRRSLLTTASIVLVLTADIVLPVPSSLVSSFAGATLGFCVGTLAVWLGMTGGCLLGYGLGRSAGHVAMHRIVGSDDVARARAMLTGPGGVALVVTRAIPVLAETLILGAGAARMPFARFLALTASANLAVALAYSAIGFFALSKSSFLILFLGLAALPTAGWLIWLRVRA